MNYPRRLVSEKKIMHIYESSSMVLGPLPAVSSWQRGIFSFGSEWSQPSSHHFTPLSSHYFRRHRPHLETAFLKVGILALSLLRKDQTYLSDHVTTFSQVLKHFYIRSHLSPPSFSSLPPSGHFLKGAWCLSDGALEMALSLSPSGGNGFGVAGLQ